MKRIVILLILTLGLTACDSLEQQARDSAAALNGALTAAQTQYQASCTANTSQPICKTINQAVAGQNALITATESYCGWSTAAPPADQNAPCVPVKSAADGLKTAIANANAFVTQLKGAIHQ